MKKIFQIICLISLSSVIYSQELIIDDSIKFKKGIYRDFYELKFNNPSIDFDYQIEEDEFCDITYYKILIDKSRAKSIGYVYGFCDGKDIYINGYISKLTPKSRFFHLKHIVRYCYFEDVFYSSTYNGITGMGNTTCGLSQNIIDIINGEKIVITKKKIKKLLKQDQDLLNEFTAKLFDSKSIKKKEELFEEYVVKFNNKSNFKINRLMLPNNIDSVLYKLSSDNSYADYYKRILGYSGDPLIIDVFLWESKYKQGNIKHIGLKAQVWENANIDYPLEIGTWRYFHKNGQIMKLIDFNINGYKNGRFLEYDKDGKLLKNKTYVNERKKN